jgi:hypothetical protein
LDLESTFSESVKPIPEVTRESWIVKNKTALSGHKLSFTGASKGFGKVFGFRKMIQLFAIGKAKLKEGVWV